MAGDEAEKFVARWAQDPECTAIALYSCTADGSRLLCDTYKITPAPTDEQRRDLFEQIEERALRQANTFGGSQAFVIEALNVGRRTLATDVFRVYGEALPGATGSIATEPANEGGHTAQMMRHNEALTRTFVSASQGQFKTLIAQIELSDRRAAAAEERSLKSLELISTIATQEREREVALRKVDSEIQLKNLIAGKVANLLPSVAGSIMGKQPGGKEMAAVTQIAGVLEGLSGDQMDGILKLLNPTQQIALLKTVKEMHAAGMLGEAKPDEGPTKH